VRTIAFLWLGPLLALAVSCRTQPANPPAGQPKAAAEAAKSGPAKAAAKPRPPAPEDALNVHTLAKHAYASGDFEKAAELYAILTAKYSAVYEPAGAEAHIVLGDALMQLKRYDLAVAAYENAVLGYLEAGRPYLLYLKLGDAYVAAGKFAQAYQVYMLAKLVYGDDARKLGVEDKMAKARAAYFDQLDTLRKQAEEQKKAEEGLAPAAAPPPAPPKPKAAPPAPDQK